MKINKKLIEVALPLEAINIASAHEKQPGIGAHPRGLHLWWARRPLAAARAVIFSQMVDDPSSHPETFPTETDQEIERKRLFKIIEDLVKWENSQNEDLLELARKEIWRSWRSTCNLNSDHPNFNTLFNNQNLPEFHDPFAGGGALPLEAQRLGLVSNASDLNPVAVIINKAMIEIPPLFHSKSPINSTWKSKQDLVDRNWDGASGLADDIIYYGNLINELLIKKIGYLYPKILINSNNIEDRHELKKYKGRELKILTWLWVRTVKSPNPAFADIDIPLASNFMLCTKKGKEVFVKPLINSNSYSFQVVNGVPPSPDETSHGTSAGKRSGFKCLMSNVPVTYEYIREQGIRGNLSVKLMAIVLEGDRERVYLSPTSDMEKLAKEVIPEWIPDTPLHGKCRVNVSNYGLNTYGDLFTNRQLASLFTLSELVKEVHKIIQIDAVISGFKDDQIPLHKLGTGALAYADAIVVYLSFAINRLADYNSSITTWKPSGEQVMQTFKRQAIPMTWDFPESNILGDSAICWKNAVKYTANNLIATAQMVNQSHGFVEQLDAATQNKSINKVISTDPPYYDNIGYADLSDFFYVWLRPTLKEIYPSLFETLASPKVDELVATPYRHNSKASAEKFFLDGMTKAMQRLADQAHPAFPVTIYYAFKQAETNSLDGTTNTGWDTFLAAVIKAGFAITGTWPMRTELSNRMIGSEANALASSIVLVCRKRYGDALIASRREFLTELKNELPNALIHLQAGNIAPVDLAQASIGPGMAVYSKFSKVIDSDGNALTVREALALINHTLDEVLSNQDGDFDSDTRWALTWFDEYGFTEGDFGSANVLAQAKATGMDGLVGAGIIASGKGKVRLLMPHELESNLQSSAYHRLTTWEIVHQLVKALQLGGETKAADLLKIVGNKAEDARELCYRLYTICERKKRSTDAQAYNGLVQSWPEITRLANEKQPEAQANTNDLFN